MENDPTTDRRADCLNKQMNCQQSICRANKCMATHVCTWFGFGGQTAWHNGAVSWSEVAFIAEIVHCGTEIPNVLLLLFPVAISDLFIYFFFSIFCCCWLLACKYNLLVLRTNVPVARGGNKVRCVGMYGMWHARNRTVRLSTEFNKLCMNFVLTWLHSFHLFRCPYFCDFTLSFSSLPTTAHLLRAANAQQTLFKVSPTWILFTVHFC